MVVTIVGIASAFVVPVMLDQGEMGVQAAGRMVLTDMLYAQNDAIAAQSSRRFVIDLDKNQYYLTDETGLILSVAWKGGSEGPNYIVDFANDRRFNGVTISAVDFGGSNTIEFDALGAPSTGGTIDLEAEDTAYRVTVAAITGRVTIQEVFAAE